jgi:trimeric autotransporter adhesin
LQFGTSGSSNSAFGYQALQRNSAIGNSAFGFDALQSNTTGTQNSSFGMGTMQVNTTGSSNSAFGECAAVEYSGWQQRVWRR